jgi:hypothetical protein
VTEDSSKTVGIHPQKNPSIYLPVYLTFYLSEHMVSHHKTIIFSDSYGPGGRDSLQFLKKDHLFLLNKPPVAPILAAACSGSGSIGRSADNAAFTK